MSFNCPIYQLICLLNTLRKTFVHYITDIRLKSMSPSVFYTFKFLSSLIIWYYIDIFLW